MKSFIKILLFCFFSYQSIAQPVSAKQHYITKGEYNDIFNWQYVLLPYSYGFTDIFFIDSLYGWASHNGNGVVRTTDSGFNWANSSFGELNYMGGVHFIDRNTGWAVGGMGRIRKTTNGGVNWIIQDYEQYAGYYNKVHFFNSDTGVVIGSKNGPYGYIIKTTNGGNNWNELFISTEYYTELYDQYWFNPDTGWVIGENILLKTNNGGINFINYYNNIPPTSNGSNLLYSVYFINNITGWISGGNIDGKNIYKTTNTGLNWFFQNNPVAQYEFSASSDVKFLTTDTGWAAIYYLGVILFTSDGGNNWLIDKMANAEFYRFAFYEKSKVWCAGEHGKIWYALIKPPIGIIVHHNHLPNDFNLYQNYPNPFNSTTFIEYDIPKTSYIKIKIYDVLGEEIETIINGIIGEGHYKITFDATALASGIYFYRMVSDDITITKKFVLIK